MNTKNHMMIWFVTMTLLFASTVLDAAKLASKDCDEEKEVSIEQRLHGFNPKYAELQENLANEKRTWVIQFLKARVMKLARNEEVLDDGEKYADFVKVFRILFALTCKSKQSWAYRQKVLNYLLIEAIYHEDIWAAMGLLFYDAEPRFACRECKGKTALAIAIERGNTKLEHLLGTVAFEQQEAYEFCREIKFWAAKLKPYPDLMDFIYGRIFSTYCYVEKISQTIVELQESALPVFCWALAYLKQQKLCAEKQVPEKSGLRSDS